MKDSDIFAIFNLRLDDKSERILGKYCNYKVLRDHENKINNSIEKYWSPDGGLEGASIEKDWFPSDIYADVFISHSSRDANLAKQLAELLKEKCQLKSFVDSAVWNHANNLLQKIDEKYCVKRKKLNGGYTYDYSMRNQSTAHVHMILQSALAKMMSKCKCVIFINTPNSINTKDVLKNKTTSPWIYNELLMANIFCQLKPHLDMLTESRGNNELDFNYTVNFKNFVDVTLDEIINTGASIVGTKSVKEVLVELELLYVTKRNKKINQGSF